MELKKPMFDGKKSLEKCIYERKSLRNFKNKKIEIEKLSQLLWVAQGIKNSNRTVPSAGATYPLEIYVNLKKQGLYHYDIRTHSLDQKIDEDIAYDLATAALGQMFINDAPINFIICADYSKITKRYGERGIRYVHMEVGHCAQNIHLEAEALDLVSVPIGAFKDVEVKQILNLSEPIEALYIIPVGYPK
ncbi:MAG: SagB/ThcOx family dehydrogenase [Candidatus Lokiarchaeota archaeon]|nr:SagB/ThcOx family dehydrogenase [Candidatus Lokiarchaeota archaeon]